MPHLSRHSEKAVIIGSGMGGLSMGIILSKLGFDVTVVEKNTEPGGMLRSYVRRGVHCNVGLHYLGALDKGQVLRRLFDFLGITANLPLEPMGINAPVDRYYFNNAGAGPRQFDVPVGLNAYEENLKRSFPKEHSAIIGFMKLLRKSSYELNQLEFLFGNPSAVDMVDQSEPLWHLLDRLGCSSGLKSVLGVPSVWFGVPPDRSPLFLHTMTLASYLASAWRLKHNGAHMVKVLVQRLADLGGRVVCGHAVSRINVRQGFVSGLTLENGEQYDAPYAIGTAHPSVVVDLLGRENVKPSYRRRIKGLVNTGGMFGVNAILPAHSHCPLPYNTFSIDTDASGKARNVIYTQLRASGRPGALLLSLITKGHDALWRPWDETNSGRRGKGYKAAKRDLARALVKKIEPVTGPLKGLELIDTYTPLTIRDWVNSPYGSAYGVMRSDTQMLSAALLNRTKIKGLYLAGQSVMAPGILGVILGSLVTAKFMVGPERFSRDVQL
ncbi:MAG: NAD(P)/FAD-dependent oxidoreductase [Desulfobacteraceae bacterium]|jgi:phytoene dehydrogenase-like protein